MNWVRKMLFRVAAPAVLAVGLGLGAVAVVPATATANATYASYHWEYRLVGYRWVAYTAYDSHGCPYTAYCRVAVYAWVKVYDY